MQGRSDYSIAGVEGHDLKRIKCEVFSRIVGYIRPIRNWNPAKRLEFDERKTYVLKKSVHT